MLLFFILGICTRGWHSDLGRSEFFPNIVDTSFSFLSSIGIFFSPSTILKSIAGLLKTKDGKIKFENDRVLSSDLKKRDSNDLRAIQLIFQNPDESLNPNHTVEQILSQPLKLYFRLAGDELKKKVAELLNKVRLGEFYMTRYPRQLSGGEKALTAVALVFAIFKLNPAPFCILDEVDAPLDDHNVTRFCELVKSMSNDIQFVFITHNKITMEIASQLLGVTMHEAGVSRLVSVDVDEAVEMAESA